MKGTLNVAKQTTAAKALFVAPTGLNSGLTSICLGLVRALDSVGLRVGFCKPVSQPREAGDTVDRSIHFARDQKSTRLNSSHVRIPYAVLFKKKKRNV